MFVEDRTEEEREEEGEQTPPETDGGRALRLRVSGDTEVSAGGTLSLTCRAQLVLNPRVDDQEILQKLILSILFEDSGGSEVDQRWPTTW